MSQESLLDVAVVGAGVAGCYATWRLSQADVHRPGTLPRVALFEAEEREGGRILTLDLPGTMFRAELGAMRYTKRHLLLSSLVSKLGLTSRPFDFPLRSYFLRGRRRSVSGASSLYRLSPAFAERGLSPAKLIVHALSKALGDLTFSDEGDPAFGALRQTFGRLHPPKTVVQFDTLSASEWELVRRFGVLHGQPLHAIGFWNVLHHYLSPDAYPYCVDGLGYESILANWNAADAIPWFLRDFHDTDYWTVQEGMDEIPFQLLIGCMDRVPVRRNHKLIALEQRSKNGSREFRLRFRQPGSAEGRDVIVRARNVVLALPPLAIGDVKFEGLAPRQHEALLHVLGTVSGHVLLKLFLGYERVWWNVRRGLGAESGKIVTDLPIRQAYFWGSDKSADANGVGVVMASYSDAHYTGFWRPLHRRAANLEQPQPYLFANRKPSGFDKAVLNHFGATDAMARKAHRQILTALGISDGDAAPPRPFVALEKEWSPGWHTWDVHVSSWDEMDRLTQPIDGVFICGEAFSEEQGWIEGALLSTERVLRRLSVGEPTWVSRDMFDECGIESLGEYLNRATGGR